jgi:hypothetical protein
MMSCHLRRSTAKLELVVSPSRASARSLSMTSPAAGEALQPFCGAEISTSTPVALHVDPDAARGDAIEHEQRADIMGSVGNRLEVVIGQDDAGGGFHMRRENDARPLLADPGGDRVDRLPGQRRRWFHCRPARP